MVCISPGSHKPIDLPNTINRGDPPIFIRSSNETKIVKKAKPFLEQYKEDIVNALEWLGKKIRIIK